MPPDHRVRVSGPWAFIGESALSRSRRSIGSPPRLTAAQTVIDLTAQPRADEVVGLITKAGQLRLTTPDRLLAELSDEPVMLIELSLWTCSPRSLQGRSRLWK